MDFNRKNVKFLIMSDKNSCMENQSKKVSIIVFKKTCKHQYIELKKALKANGSTHDCNLKNRKKTRFRGQKLNVFQYLYLNEQIGLRQIFV